MKPTLPAHRLERLIFEFRGIKVMVDTDLATLYEVETKRLKEQVKRNIERFPEDFMFELNGEEKEQLVANCDRLANLKHSVVPPLVFTEQGIAMLSSVLRSKKAVQMNIAIMRAFAQYRALLMENVELRKEMKALDAKLNEAFKYLLERMDALSFKYESRKRIGFKGGQEK